jgi:uncharacterized protein YggU (UPF0235/DUF167 family)
MIEVVVVPRATRTRVMGLEGGALKIYLSAMAEEKSGNRSLVAFLASSLDIPRAQIEIVGGASSKRKTVRLARVSRNRVLLALKPRAS